MCVFVCVRVHFCQMLPFKLRVRARPTEGVLASERRRESGVLGSCVEPRPPCHVTGAPGTDGLWLPPRTLAKEVAVEAGLAGRSSSPLQSAVRLQGSSTPDRQRQKKRIGWNWPLCPPPL